MYNYLKLFRGHFENTGTRLARNLNVNLIRFLFHFPSAAQTVPNVGAPHLPVVSPTFEFFHHIGFGRQKEIGFPLGVVERVEGARRDDPESSAPLRSHPADVVDVAPALQHSRNQLRPVVSPNEPPVVGGELLNRRVDDLVARPVAVDDARP